MQGYKYLFNAVACDHGVDDCGLYLANAYALGFKIFFEQCKEAD